MHWGREKPSTAHSDSQNIKVNYEGASTIIPFQISVLTNTYRIAELFTLLHSHLHLPPTASLNLYYLDSETELVRITTDAELADAIKYFEGFGPLHLYVRPAGGDDTHSILFPESSPSILLESPPLSDIIPPLSEFAKLESSAKEIPLADFHSEFPAYHGHSPAPISHPAPMPAPFWAPPASTASISPPVAPTAVPMPHRGFPIMPGLLPTFIREHRTHAPPIFPAGPFGGHMRQKMARYKEALDTLASMGFGRSLFNLSLLKKFNGDITSVVNTLVQQQQHQQSVPVL
eukprot:TRINITY_DN404_c0_g1_i1.p1 TRINITY_DN404_c0_g1~~TRINITY_DN404_c0_g1_i1.p1  ORF type:complete len:302 (+),score=-4.50 TRINITY_DN404_c0_g1_i1:41-907(+)